MQSEEFIRKNIDRLEAREAPASVSGQKMHEYEEDLTNYRQAIIEKFKTASLYDLIKLTIDKTKAPQRTSFFPNNTNNLRRIQTATVPSSP